MFKGTLKHYFFVVLLVLTATTRAQRPCVAIVMVVDQFAYSYLPKLSPFFKGGVRFLLDNAIVYQNAYYPHAIPATAVGHTAFTTGTYAKDHGIIDNAWFDGAGTKVESDQDTPENAAVFSPTGFYNEGRSAHRCMVDNISDQAVMASKPDRPVRVYSFAIKSRAAIAMAGKLGKAVWFDGQTGNFTSSKAFYKQALPEWLTLFNLKSKIGRIKSVTWKTAYPRTSTAYRFNNINNYSFAHGPSIIGKKLPVCGLVSADGTRQECEHADGQKPFSALEKNPMANQLLFDLALQCLDSQETQDGLLVLMISFSSLDLVGHDFGPDSLECIDMLYHFDKQLNQFMKQVNRRIDPQKTLFVLTSDHGIPTMPEILHAEGLPAERILMDKLIPTMNDLLKETVGVSNLIINFQPTQFFVDEKKFAELDEQTRTKVLENIKEFLRKQPGIMRVWDFDELAKSTFEPEQLENYFKQQLYPGRSGRIIYQALPNMMTTTYDKGDSHISPYESDTHVPLMIYQRGMYQHAHRYEKVWMLQLANTLSYILGVPKPSASTFAVLPGIIKQEEPCPVVCEAPVLRVRPSQEFRPTTDYVVEEPR